MLTELDIVNSMLGTIGVGGLTSSDTQHPDYMTALQVLRIARIGTNKLGHWYNTTTPTLLRNEAGEITLPASVLHCDPVDRARRCEKRGLRLYDLDNRTYVFEADVRAKVITDLELDEMPETAKYYVMAAARYAFYFNEDGDGNKLQHLLSERSIAWAELYREHLRNRDISTLDGPAAKLLARGRTYSAESQVNGYFR